MHVIIIIINYLRPSCRARAYVKFVTIIKKNLNNKQYNIIAIVVLVETLRLKY